MGITRIESVISAGLGKMKPMLPLVPDKVRESAERGRPTWDGWDVTQERAHNTALLGSLGLDSMA